MMKKAPQNQRSFNGSQPVGQAAPKKVASSPIQSKAQGSSKKGKTPFHSHQKKGKLEQLSFHVPDEFGSEDEGQGFFEDGPFQDPSSSDRAVPNRAGPKKRTKIERLSALLTNTVVAGMIVNVRDPNAFMSKKTGEETFVRNFIIKDDSGTIACVLWSNSRDRYDDLLKIGNLVEITNADVRSKPEGAHFKEIKTSSGYELHISSSKDSSITGYAGSEAFREPLLSKGWMPLNDVLQLRDQLMDAEVSLLVCVKKISPEQEIVTKQEKHIKKRELIVFDQTESHFPLILWGAASAAIESFVVGETVLLITCVKISTFRNSTQGTLGFSSLIDVNPDLTEANLLFDFAQTVDIQEQDYGSAAKKEIDVSQIHERYSVREIQDRIMGLKSGEGFAGFGEFNLLRFEIDSPIQGKDVVYATCTKCQTKVPAEMSCSCSPESELPIFLTSNAQLSYDLPITFVDHSASLTLRLSQALAIRLFGIPPDEFLILSEIERTELKFSRLFKKFKVYFKVEWQVIKEERLPRVFVLSLEMLD